MGKPEAATGGVLCKKVFLKISQNLQKNFCVGISFLIKLQTSGKYTEGAVKIISGSFFLMSVYFKMTFLKNGST